jgi:hypothetical protein
MSAPPVLTPFAAASAAPVSSSAPAVESAQERKASISVRAEDHFEKHRTDWISRRYGELLRKDPPAPSLTPAGQVDDRQARLMRTATHLVERQQARRMLRIERAGNARGKGPEIGR